MRPSSWLPPLPLPLSAEGGGRAGACRGGGEGDGVRRLLVVVLALLLLVPGGLPGGVDLPLVVRRGWSSPLRPLVVLRSSCEWTAAAGSVPWGSCAEPVGSHKQGQSRNAVC